MGMVPWAGAPTAAWGVTFALAFVTFATVWVFGIQEFGVVGFFLNQIPGIALGRPSNIFLRVFVIVFETLLKTMILAIELLGLFIKHAVLSVRLLANMVAGHLVILAVMGLAFSAEAAVYYADPSTPGWKWWLTAAIAIAGSTAFSVLELFVAFLQAYVFTFLSALFINFAIHKH
jgi:F-type H+-transporting ATPase subunit a